MLAAQCQKVLRVACMCVTRVSFTTFSCVTCFLLELVCLGFKHGQEYVHLTIHMHHFQAHANLMHVAA